MTDSEVGIRLSLKERRETAAGLKEVSGDLATVGRQAQTSGRLAGASSKGFAAMRKTGRAAALGIKLGFAAALGAGYAAVKLLRSSFAEAREAERVGKVTEARIRSTGKAANLTAKQIGRLSFAIGKKTSIDDESIQSGANWLLTFKNIRNEQGKGNKIFTQALKITTDYAASLAGSNSDVTLKSASIAVGKALNDPVKGLTALAKAGVTFSAGQIERIKGFVTEGKLMAAQKIELRELQSEFGGTARAQATMGDKVSFVWGNIQERLGTDLLPLLNKVERWFLRKGVPAVEGFLDTFEKKGIPAIGRFEKKARPLVNELLPAMGSVLGDVRDVLSDAAPYAVKLVRAFNNMPDWAKKAAGLTGVGLVVGSKTGALGALKNILVGKGAPGSSGGLLGSAKPVPVIIVADRTGGRGGGGIPIPGGGSPESKPSRLGKWGGRLGRFGRVLAPFIAETPGLVTLGDMGNETKSPADRGMHPINPGTNQFAQTFGHYDLPGTSKSLMTIVREADRLRGFDAMAAFSKAPQAKSDLDQLLKPLTTAETHTKNLGQNLDKVGKTKVAPSFSTPGLDQSRTSSQQYIDLLTHRVPRTITTTYSVSTSSALASINHVLDVASSSLGGWLGHREHGGPVKAGRPYVVGEKRPEVFVPNVPGTILPRVPGSRGDLEARVSSAEPLIVQLVLDGKVITETVIRDLKDRDARR